MFCLTGRGSSAMTPTTAEPEVWESAAGRSVARRLLGVSPLGETGAAGATGATEAASVTKAAGATGETRATGETGAVGATGRLNSEASRLTRLILTKRIVWFDHLACPAAPKENHAWFIWLKGHKDKPTVLYGL
jgi:hypothetical protein